MRAAFVGLSLITLAGCANPPTVPLPNANVALAAAVIYLIVDPMAPNWRIEEHHLADDRFYLSLRQKRFTEGGAGEARQVFQRRAAQLAALHGFAGYEIVRYNEGVESAFPNAERVAEGTIALVGGRG